MYTLKISIDLSDSYVTMMNEYFPEYIPGENLVFQRTANREMIVTEQDKIRVNVDDEADLSQKLSQLKSMFRIPEAVTDVITSVIVPASKDLNQLSALITELISREDYNANVQVGVPGDITMQAHYKYTASYFIYIITVTDAVIDICVYSPDKKVVEVCAKTGLISMNSRHTGNLASAMTQLQKMLSMNAKAFRDACKLYDVAVDLIGACFAFSSVHQVIIQSLGHPNTLHYKMRYGLLWTLDSQAIEPIEF